MFSSKKFYIVLIIVVFGLSFVSFFVSLTSINIMTKNNIEEFEKSIINQKKKELEDRVNIVYKIIETNYNNTLLDCRIKKSKKILKERMDTLFNILNAYYNKHKNDSNIKDDIKLIVSNATFNPKEFYFWINDLTPKMIIHPIIKKLNNMDLINFKDNHGKYLFKDMISLIKKNSSGFMIYYWKNPANNKVEQKISYVRLFKPLKWIIGTGIYLADNTNEIKRETLEEIKNAKFGKNGYFWVNNMNYKMIMHPIKPEYDGKIFINTPKVPFVELGVNALKKSKKDYAFIAYKFYNPATKKYERKLSIVKLFKPWNWVIGTGVYLTDVDKTISNMKNLADKELKKIVEMLVIINIFVIVLILLIAKNFLDRYEELATKDKLTNIFNRLKIDDLLAEQVEISKRYKRNLSLIFFDIDHFKNVNDTYGHKVGDYILQEIAKLVSDNIRKSDFFGRWGGEEFLIILPETNEKEAYRVAEKLRKIIEQHEFKKVGKITCSFGVTSYKPNETINELIERVDKLLYLSKENGRNRVSKEIT